MQKRRTASLIAITRAARHVSARSAKRNGPARNGSGLCFVETSRMPGASAPYTSACTRCVWTRWGRSDRRVRASRTASAGSTSRGADNRSNGTSSSA